MSKPIHQFGFYVYILYREDGITPFYVGKGGGSRWLDHEKHAHRGISYKDRIIQKMIASGITVPKKKIATGLTNKQACDLEIEVIAEIGRQPNGPLVNVTSGGDGVRNVRLTLEQRAKISARWKPHPPEVEARRIAAAKAVANDPDRRARISAALKGRKFSPERKARMAEARIGIKMPLCSSERRQRLSDALRGKPKSPEHVAKMRARKISAESIEKMRAALTGRVLTDTHRAAISAGSKGVPKPNGFGEKIRKALLGRSLPQETIEKIRTSNTGKTLSDETRARMSASRQGKKKSPEHAAKLAANLQRYWAERKALKEATTIYDLSHSADASMHD